RLSQKSYRRDSIFGSGDAYDKYIRDTEIIRFAIAHEQFGLRRGVRSRPSSLPKGGSHQMLRSLRWPMLAVALAGGVAIGRWTELSPVQGRPVPPVVIPAELTSYRDV